MNIWRRSKQSDALTLALVLCVSVAATAQRKDDKDARDKDSDKKPKLTLKAQPVISMSPSKVTLRAELVGGANDYQEYYCPTIEWSWGDGTQSESTADCQPYEAGKSEIKRRFVVDHVFRAGYYQVAVRLKRGDKAVAMATTAIQVQGGADFGR
jgi:hypothetical protein